MKIGQLKKAFTVLEIILVIFILAITVGFSILYFQGTQVRSDLNTQTSILVSYLRLAQSNAISGRTGQPTGIHLNSNSYVLFVGPTYNAASSTNYTSNLPATLNIQNVSLNGGGTDIVFTTPFGESNKFGSFNLRSEQINKTNTITVSANGIINY